MAPIVTALMSGFHALFSIGAFLGSGVEDVIGGVESCVNDGGVHIEFKMGFDRGNT
jgi:phage-related minor tail protein